MSTATRSLIGFLFVAAVAFYLLLDKLTKRVERQYMEAVEETMVDTAHVLAAIVEQAMEENAGGFEAGGLRAALEGAHRRRFEARIYNLTKTEVSMHIYVTDGDGIVIFDSDEGRTEGEDFTNWRDVALTLSGSYGARSTRLEEDDDLTSVLYIAAPVYREGEIVGSLTVSKPQSTVFFFRDETRSLIFRTGMLSLLATGLAAILVSVWMSRPVRQLTDYARAIRQGERSAHPKLATPEMRTLGRALEEMRDSLEDRKYVENYVQTLTHEMKSPVAAIQGAAELLQEPDVPEVRRQRFLTNITGETARLQHIIDRLLALASIESLKTLEKPVELNLATLVNRVCHEYRSALESKSIRLETEVAPECRVRGEEFLLEMAVSCLLQNARDFSPEGSTIRITLAPDSEGEVVSLILEDEGSGIPDYALERVFDRFYSLQHPDTGKKSSGLGLCFVREAAELHGGKARLENREDGRGARAILSLPAEG